MVEVMGIEHVGIGSDFDGGGGLVGFDDVSQMPNITQELLARGYTKEELCIAKMFLYTARFLRNHRVSLSETISWLQPYNPGCLGALGSSRILSTHQFDSQAA